MSADISLTGVERFFDDDELIVSKTDLKGRLTYCNDVFLRIAGYTEKECMGEPHSMIRHPDMPRCVFHQLWEHIQDKREIFAYVINRTKQGDYYWVLAHVTPSMDMNGKIIGYHSNRRVPDRKILEGTIIPLYEKLLAEEKSHSNRKEGMQASNNILTGILSEAGVEYGEFIARL